MRIQTTFAAAVAAALLISPGAAVSEAVSKPSAGAVPSVSIAVEGEVRSVCQLPAVPDLDLGNLAQSRRTATFEFPIRCNQPFELEIRSGGALTHHEIPEGQGPFAGALPYSLEVALPLRGPSSSRMATRAADSAQLRRGVLVTTGQDISAGDGTLTLVLANNPAPGLLAGRYGDTITLTLKPGL